MPQMQLKEISEKGNTLLMMMFVMASIAAGGAYVMNLMSESEKHLSREVKIENYKTIVQAIKNNLFTGNNCSAALGLPRNLNNSLIIIPPDNMRNYVPHPLYPLPPSNLGARVSINLSYGTSPAPIQFNLLPVQKWRANGVTIEDVRLRIDPTRTLRNTTVQWDSPSPPMTAAIGEITLVPSDPDIPLAASKYRDLRIKTLIYYYLQGGVPRVVGCFDPEGPANLCTINGGAYNPSPGVPENQRCQPDLHCFVHRLKVYTNPSQCPAPYTAETTGGSLVIHGNGRLDENGQVDLRGTTATHQLRYICQWCNGQH